ATTPDARSFVEFGKANAKGPIGFVGWAIQHPAQAKALLKATSAVPSVLSTQYWSGSAYRLGSRATKFTVRPCQDIGAEIPKNAGDNYLKEDLVRRLSEGEACFDFLVQFQLDPVKNPVENAFIEWKEKD